MELKKIVTFLLAAVVATSCRNADVTPIHPGTVVLPVKLKTKNESKPLRMSDIFEDVSYVYLDDSDGESLIGKISDIRITDGGIYVGDAFNNIVLQFDKSGKFIRSFSHHGRGRVRAGLVDRVCFDDGVRRMRSHGKGFDIRYGHA